MHEFDRQAWAAAGSQEADLADLVARSFRGTRDDQLTVSLVLGEFDDVHSWLVKAAVDRVAESALGRREAALRVRQGDDSYTLSIWRDAPGVSLLAGTPPFTDERWRRVERWLRALEPRFAGVFLDEEDFEGICEALAFAGRVEVSRMTARVLADGSSYTRGWPEDATFERPTYEQALEEVAPIAAVHTLTLHVSDRLSLHLRRLAGATYYSGDFGLFTDAVIGGLSRAVTKRRQLLLGRDRQPESAPVSAIALELGSPVFRDPGALRQLVSHISEQRGLGVAVLHRNPYFHVAITDYLDGSNYDVFVTSESEVTIFPGYRATLGSLARTSDALAERFTGLALTEVPVARPPTREELFSTG